MNREEENERAMPSNQDTSGTTDGVGAAADGSTSDDTPRPGTTDVQAYIGRQLRAVYDDVVKQPIPDRLLALMKQLEEGHGKG